MKRFDSSEEAEMYHHQLCDDLESGKVSFVVTEFRDECPDFSEPTIRCEGELK